MVSRSKDVLANHIKERAVSALREYTVIVADDEQMISNGISRMISQECENTRVVATCYDGTEVIKTLEEEPVDLVITDICMPETDGLQIAEYIHKNKLPTKVIVVTAYRNFEYAQSALEYGVSRIISKPLDSDELYELICSYRDEKESREYVASQISETKKIINEHLFFCKQLGLYISGELNYSELKGFFEKTNRGFAEKPCALIKLSVPPQKSFSNEHNNWRNMCETDNEKSVAFCINDNISTATVLLFVMQREIDIVTKQYIDEIKTLFKKAFGVEVKATYKLYENLMSIIVEGTRSVVTMYVDYLMSNNYGAIADLTHTFDTAYDFEWVRNFCYALVNYLNDCIELDVTYYLNRLKFIENKKDLLSFLSELTKNTSFDSDKRVVQVKYYISQHYAEGISLRSIADIFNISHTYLSKIFHDETGESFGNYIIKFRMKKAKEFLIRGKHSIEEVSELLGYNSVHYFLKVFKKETGMTPKQYITAVVQGERK